jgi:hypothetical protein
MDLAAVATYPKCEGPKAAFDLFGNAYEWIDACSSADPSAGCQIKGGDWFSLAVDCTHGITQPRMETTFSRFGIRCCSDVK